VSPLPSFYDNRKTILFICIYSNFIINTINASNYIVGKIMTGQEIKTKIETLIDKTIDDDLALDLINTAKDEIEGERDWEFLKKSGNPTPSTTTIGGTYTTAYTLPSDFAHEIKIYVGDTEVFPITQEEAIMYKGNDKRYFIDMANKYLYFTGTIGTSETITIIYIAFTADLTLATSPSWDARFKKIIAYEAAQLYLSGLDTDDLSARMYPFIKAQGDKLKDNMIAWDAERKLKAIDNSTTFRPTGITYQDNILP
jgi:hypothetical protein